MLRAESAFGVIPQLDSTQIATDGLPGVQAALDRVVNSANRELPQSVVVHRRYQHTMPQVANQFRAKFFSQDIAQPGVRVFGLEEKSGQPPPPVPGSEDTSTFLLEHGLKFDCRNLSRAPQCK